MERNSIENDSILCFQFVILVAVEFEKKTICNQARNEAEKIINSIITSFFSEEKVMCGFYSYDYPSKKIQ